jgi:hypothetical protein
VLQVFLAGLELPAVVFRLWQKMVLMKSEKQGRKLLSFGLSLINVIDSSPQTISLFYVALVFLFVLLFAFWLGKHQLNMIFPMRA